MKEINEAVILVGGMGTRLLPYTKTIPKEMISIYDVPAIYLIIREAYLSGIKKIIFIVTKRNKSLIENFFSNDEYLNEFIKGDSSKEELVKELKEMIKNITFKYVYQSIRGTFGALYSARNYIKRDYFLVMYCDDLIDNEISVTEQLLNEFKKDEKMYIALKKSNYEELPKVGVAKLDKNNYLLNFVPKDEDNSKAILHGRMILNKKVFKVKNQLIVHDHSEYYLPYALLKFNDVKGYFYQGEYFDLGSKLGCLKASIHYCMKTSCKDDLIKYLKDIK